MSKLKDKIMIAMFVLFIFVMFVLFIFLPKIKTSVNEKRNLAEFPELSVKTIFDGKFEKGVEDYLTDHFPYRDEWVSINAYYTLKTGRNGVSGVYKGNDGYLMNTPITSDATKFEQNIEAIRNFAKSQSIPVKMIIVPTAGSVMTDKLPKNHAPYPDNEYIDKAEDELSDCVSFIDIRERFKELKDSEQLYYKTDHHWTVEGAYEVYKLYQQDAKDKSEFNVENYNGFFGTTYSKSALWNEKSDNISVWTYPTNVNVTISDGLETTNFNDMFFRNHLNEPDKYPVYLDGNHSYERIENYDIAEGRTLVIKDSYAHCLVPFLALHNNVVDMVDLRYYLEPVSKLIEEEQYDNILIVYGLSNIVEASDINILE